jgi:hypothetical protein
VVGHAGTQIASFFFGPFRHSTLQARFPVSQVLATRLLKFLLFPPTFSPILDFFSFLVFFTAGSVTFSFDMT